MRNPSYLLLWLKHGCFVLGILAAKVLHGLFPGFDHLLQYQDTLYKTRPLDLIVEGYESVRVQVDFARVEELKDVQVLNEQYRRTLDAEYQLKLKFPDAAHLDGEAPPFQQFQTERSHVH